MSDRDSDDAYDASEYDSEYDTEFDTADFDGDESLRALLRGGDPAASLPPADPAGLTRLLGDIMSADLDIRPADPEQAVPHRRTRATWLVAAAAVAAIAAGGAFAVAGLTGNGSNAPQADQKPSTTAQAGAPLAGQTTNLSVAPQQGRCASPDPAILSQYPLAFAGTVTSVEGDTVTLEATDVFAGEVGETVQISAPPDLFGAMQGMVHFEEGGDYLVAAFDGQLSMCYSGTADGDLASPFQKAFVH
jgi:hypothetical protein